MITQPLQLNATHPTQWEPLQLTQNLHPHAPIYQIYIQNISSMTMIDDWRTFLRRRRVRRARSAWSRREETTTRPPLAPFAPERPTFAPQPPESSHTATIQVTRHNGRSLWYILPDWMCLLVNICILFRVWVIPRMDQCETGDDSGYLSAVGGRFARVRINIVSIISSLLV